MLACCGSSSLCGTIPLELCEAREHPDILLGFLMAHRATVPRQRLPREPDLLPDLGTERTWPFSPSTHNLPSARLHLLSKRPQTGQHFLHSKAMRGISLLRQLDPLQRRRAAKFPPPPQPPAAKQGANLAPGGFLLASTSALAVCWRWGGRGPLHCPPIPGLCPRERAASAPDRTRGVRALPKCSR